MYAVRYPQGFASLLEVLSIANLHLFRWLPGFHSVCLGMHSLEIQLWFKTLSPVVVAAVAFVVDFICCRRRQAQVQAEALPKRPFPEASLPFVLGWTFLLFPTLSSSGFRSLAPCDCFEYADGERVCFLREDYAVECAGRGPASAPMSVIVPACVAIAIWAVGVPLLYAVLICYDAHKPYLRGSLGLLNGDYKRQASAWELMAVRTEHRGRTDNTCRHQKTQARFSPLGV